MILNLEFCAKSQIEMGLKVEPVLCAVWISLYDLKLWFFVLNRKLRWAQKKSQCCVLFGLV